MLTLEDLAKYPFSVEAQSYVKSRGLTVEELSSPEHQEVLKRALERVEEALNKALVSVKLDRLDVEIFSYPVAVLMVSLSGDKIITSRFAEAEAKRAFSLLREESPDKLLSLASGTFNWDVKRARLNVGYRIYEFSVRWEDYLKVALGFKSPHWKLINRVLVSGRVYLQRHELARMMAEAIRERLLEKASAAPQLSEPPQPVREGVERILELAKTRVSKKPLPIVEAAVKSSEEAYPPCIKTLLEEAQAGKQLPHMARFTLASFMLSIGKSIEEVIEVFRRLPDFDERKTLYHVKHIAGEIGAKTRYTPPNCETLRTFNLCVAPDSLCQRIKHPLSYYKRALRGGASP